MLGKFFTLLGEQRCQRITHVSADAADWVARAVEAHCPQAVRALDQARRDAWNRARA